MMPWREAYWPVRIEARLGEQSGVVWNALSNWAPSRARRSMCGVFMYGCPEAPVSSKRRSSTRITIRLGFISSSVVLTLVDQVLGLRTVQAEGRARRRIVVVHRARIAVRVEHIVPAPKQIVQTGPRGRCFTARGAGAIVARCGEVQVGGEQHAAARPAGGRRERERADPGAEGDRVLLREGLAVAPAGRERALVAAEHDRAARNAGAAVERV